VTQSVIHFTDGIVFGGAEQVLLTTLRGLDRERWHSVLYHRSDADIAPLLEGGRAAGIYTRAIVHVPSEPFLSRIVRLARLFRSENCAIFHAHLPLPEYCRAALIAAALARVPAIIATTHLFRNAPSRRSLLYQRILSGLVDRYIAVSYDLRRHLIDDLRIPKKKITVIHNGVAMARLEPPRDDRPMGGLSDSVRQPIVLTCARLHEQKGLMHLLEAVSLVPQARFVIAGDGPQRIELEECARTLALNGRVLFLGHRDDVPMLLAGCDIFVLPSLFEGLPLALLEAMEAGKPIIASAVGGISEAVIDGKTGLLVPPARPQLLANAIQKLIENPIFANQLATAGKARVMNEFTDYGMVQRLMHLYEQLSPR
jgi:glycosyltransferase involved in cell wall biosynthesis